MTVEGRRGEASDADGGGAAVTEGRERPLAVGLLMIYVIGTPLATQAPARTDAALALRVHHRAPHPDDRGRLP